MARPQKQTVDYFPHQCQHKKTMFILEERWGNDGYAFWFKLLEVLGNTKDHYLDLSDSTNMEFLQAKTHLSEVSTVEILDLLAKLQAIDPEVWAVKAVWCQNFVDGVASVYQNRKQEVPQKPSFYDQKLSTDMVSTDDNPQVDGVSTDKSTQSRVKETIVEETIVEKTRVKAGKNALDVDAFNEFWSAYPAKKAKGDAEKAFEKISPSEELLSKILQAIEHQKVERKQRQGDGTFVPEWKHPATWLNKRCWDDEIAPRVIIDDKRRIGRVPSPSEYETPEEYCARKLAE